jgi:DMSO/TMAO reductase YedYZ heme-binding membrane subunit
MSHAADRSLTAHRTWAAWAFFALAVVLVIGWPIAAIVNWDDIVDSHVRLGYLVGDIGLVVPLCFATWYGLRKQRRWAPGLLMLTIGATAYDAIHFFIYLAQERFLSIPPAGYIAILVAALAALTLFAVRELRAQVAA